MKPNWTLDTAVKFLTKKWKHCGTVEISTWDEYVKQELQSTSETYQQIREGRDIKFLPSPDVLVVNYDFADDDLSDVDRELFRKDLNFLWDGLSAQPKKLHHIDGSGNGLYYGIALFAAK